jgi:glyoxylase-like metal-dependent hydrolase (beta-lactamase superfamily II)
MNRIITILFLLCTSLIVKAQTNWDTIQIRSEKVAGNIYILKGSGGNIGVLTGKDGILMVDDQFLPLSEKIKDAIAALDNGVIKFTINTHIHGDHSGGNEYFKQIGSTVVAHDVVRERMMKEHVNKANNRTTPPRERDAWPIVTFAGQLNIHLNDQDIELIHFNPGHTDGDIVIRFRQANVFHMGDMFVTYGYPYIDISNGGTVTGLITALDKVMGLMDENTKVIPGHGNLCTKADVKKYRDRLANIRDQVAAALKNGKKVEDLAGLGITDAYDAEWGKGFIKGKDFVLIVAEDMKPGSR